MKFLMNVGVVGCGYVGLSTTVAIADKNEVYLFDIDKNKIKLLNENHIPFAEMDLERDYNKYKTNILIEKKRERFIKNCDIFVLAISTDLDSKIGALNTIGIESWIREISIQKAPDSFLIVIRSTIPIGFTDRMISNYNCNKIVYWPEFLREGNAYYDIKNPTRVVIGGTRKNTSILINLLYGEEQRNIPIHYVTSKEAEAIKLFSNSYLAMRVAFFNELDAFAEKNNMDVRHIIEGVCDDSRIGQFYNNPSFGYGGYCLPKDTRQLATILGSEGVLINAVVSSNEKRKKDIAQRIIKLGNRIGVYRLQMKKNSDNIRGAAIVDVIKELTSSGVHVNVYEPILNKEPELLSGVFLCNNLRELADDSDIIISNRMYDELIPYSNKVYTRDIFFRD